jgi:hypothetical protein
MLGIEASCFSEGMSDRRLMPCIKVSCFSEGMSDRRLMPCI